MSNGAILRLHDVTCSLSGNPVLQGVGFDVAKGAFIGIIGPNGSGKTTLIKCISRLIPHEGTVLLDGAPMSEMGRIALARRIAVMHQETVPGFSFTAREIVMMGRHPHQRRFSPESDADRQAVARAMRETDTMHLRDKPIDEMSGGERQRVFLAKAIAQDTDILLLDEPSASLDMAHEEHIFRHASEWCAAGGTILAAVHDLRVAARYCTRLVLLSDGHLVQEGTPEEVLTGKTLSATYGVNALVYRSRTTGSLEIHLVDRPEKVSFPAWFSPTEEHAVPWVHLIGGGGSASAAMRFFFEAGWHVTAGVVAEADSDRETAVAFGIPCLTCNPFLPIPEDVQRENERYSTESDLTVLCGMPVGRQNLGNLLAAGSANRLALLAAEPFESRDFTGGEALRLYRSLEVRAATILQSDLFEQLL